MTDVLEQSPPWAPKNGEPSEWAIVKHEGKFITARVSSLWMTAEKRKRRASEPDDEDTPEEKRRWQNSTAGRRESKARQVFAKAELALIEESPYKRLPPARFKGIDYRINDYGCVINYDTGKRLKPFWKKGSKGVQMYQLQTTTGKQNLRADRLYYEALIYERQLCRARLSAVRNVSK